MPKRDLPNAAMHALEDIYELAIEIERHAAAVRPSETSPMPTRTALLFHLNEIRVKASRLQLVVMKEHPKAPMKTGR